MWQQHLLHCALRRQFHHRFVKHRQKDKLLYMLNVVLVYWCTYSVPSCLCVYVCVYVFMCIHLSISMCKCCCGVLTLTETINVFVGIGVVRAGGINKDNSIVAKNRHKGEREAFLKWLDILLINIFICTIVQTYKNFCYRNDLY